MNGLPEPWRSFPFWAIPYDNVGENLIGRDIQGPGRIDGVRPIGLSAGSSP